MYVRTYVCVGEEVCVALYGGAIDVNVRLDRNTVKMENTYITLSSQRYILTFVALVCGYSAVYVRMYVRTCV